MTGSIGALIAGVEALNAQSDAIGIVADNIANSQTIGFKQRAERFETLVSSPGDAAWGGVRTAPARLTDQQGALVVTQSAGDLAINGTGFFVVTSAIDPTTSAIGPAAPLLLTRKGDFHPNADGFLVNSAGYYLLAAPAGASSTAPAGASSTAPAGASSTGLAGLAPVRQGPQAPTLVLAANGDLAEPAAHGPAIVRYHLPLATVINPDRLAEVAGNAYAETADSGAFTLASAAGYTLGADRLEQSNVDLNTQFADMIVSQRNYQAASKVVVTADQMYSTVTHLNRA